MTKNQETIHELDWHDHNWHNEVPETLLKSVITEIIGQDGEIKKLRRSCNRFGYTTSIRENIVNVKQNAVSRESKLKTTSCTLKVDVAYHYGTEKQKWIILGNEEVEAEPSQAQTQRKPESN